MIKCSSDLAEVPFYMEACNTEIFSLEELCEVCLQNQYWITKSILSPDFISWIRNQLKLTNLADQLTNQIQQDVSFEEIIRGLLESCDYLTGNEIESILYEVSQNQSISEFEKMLRYGDNLLQKEWYRTATKEYLKMIDFDFSDQTKEMQAKVFECLGTSYAGRMYYEQAISSYEKSYALNPEEKVLEKIASLKQNKCNDIIVESNQQSLAKLNTIKKEYRLKSR